MPQLEIQHRNGNVETVEISTENPMLIGSNLSSDIYLDAPGIAAVHCRIQWTGSELEVQAATPAGVVLNGKTVAKGTLQHGGMFRVGDVNLLLRTTSTAPPPVRAASDSIDLKPTSGEDVDRPNVFQAPSSPRPSEPRPMKPSPPGPPEKSVDTFDEIYQEPDGDEPSQLEWLDEALAEGDDAEAVEVADGDAVESLEALDDGEAAQAAPGMVLQRGGGVSSPARSRGTAAVAPPKLPRMPVGRRSQRDPLRSPVVMILGGTLIGLALLTGTIYFLVGRQQTQREFDHAMDLHKAGNYAQAIEALEKFVVAHPSHDLADTARVTIATDLVDQPLTGAVPDWAKGLEQLKKYLDNFSNQASFKKPESPLRQFVVNTSLKIALGATQSAKLLRRKPLLDVAEESRRLYDSYVPETDQSKASHLQDLREQRKMAEDAILQHEVFEKGAKNFDDALAKKEAVKALDVYRRLLVQYKDFATFKPLQDRVRKSLELEQQLAVRETPNKAAVNTDRPLPAGAAVLSLNLRTRIRSDRASVGSTVFAVAGDCAYGVDTVIGEPVWRRPIGLDTPFFPMRVATSVPAVLMFDTRYRELVLVEERTAKLLWRQALEESVLGTPLVVEGQIYVAGKSGSLFQVDLNTGKLAARLKFSQGITGGPALSESGDRMYVAGNDAILYSLTRRPLGCEKATWLGHGPGAIVAPLLMMKSYLLLADNDRVASCQLRLFDTSRDGQTPTEIVSRRVLGRVRSPSVIRGKQLFVPSEPERITAFTVSEKNDASALVEIATHALKEGRKGAIYLAAGPDDQLWATGSALQKYQLMKEILRPDGKKMAVGLTAQPVQMSGESLFVGRQPFYSGGVLFGEYERNSMTPQWQVALGGRVLEITNPTSAGGSFVCITSLGNTYQISRERLTKGGFEIQASGNLQKEKELDDATTPLGATRFPDGQVVVRGGKPPQLWFLAADGSVAREFKTPGELQVDPVLLTAGIVLPLSGRMSLVSKTSGAKVAEDWVISLGQGETPSRWTSVVPMDDSQFMALNDAGRVSRVQFRNAPAANLAEVAHWDVGSPINTKLVVGSGRVLLTDNQPRLVMLEASSLEPQGEQPLSAPAAQAPWMLGDQVFVDVGSQKLACYDASSKLKLMWEIPLGGTSVGGTPLTFGDLLLVVLQDGRIWKIDPSNGKIQEESSYDIQERIVFGPRPVGDKLIIGTLSGGLVSLDAIFRKGQ